MGRIAKVVQFLRAVRDGANISDTVVDPGGEPTITAIHTAGAGDDSFPLPTDFAYISTDEGAGREVATGYADPLNTPKATAGDKRIYARDPSTGAVVVELWLKSDGTAVTENSAGSFTLAPDGRIEGANGAGYFRLRADGYFEVNGVTIAPDGQMTASTGLLLGGKEINDHTHPILTGSSAGTTGENNP